ncbi:MAG: hypothetical protein M1470_11135 [Bacteroidetes bacterium]|nr:hypothetical protein [Bacteroidota bacterium]MCL5739007.1 hypothetical protein [Bacteroidota bacterium]
MSDKSKKDKSQTNLKGARHYFFLNPYGYMAFSRCPKCEEKTKIRKCCLLIHVEPNFLLSLNKSCGYCPTCDLIIVKQADLERLLIAICEQNAPDIIGNEYFVYGTMDRKAWRNGQTEKVSHQEAIKCSYPFKDIWKFEVSPAGWYPEKQVKAEIEKYPDSV